ncbi:hypothetical protein A3C23_01510 [Candidatus Roizmanbacteria bacterium RIFCSPHIGHO2_02_FULL_37_13b]|uniref:Uncharacterized protein n=1 Tax=Candidatus Roizmanbacteria bacterium RIFCSPLOWO2_02_FULL_36_11 TaxID=1802071 RepID=A0A1F7JIK0_9BACT|nr:MAG: hypothetical protein A3C23_01510 [Candidatus Roizmanbacteria bacterium RIFCSPHIGHO2_02_FULL_37_13b]OGK55415.1 MAG: hypothetical protein A3H78_05980 [Candidatus Roizmanbacteria bacterium RIFCSPLOWO2_02_FULL_36_11]
MQLFRKTPSYSLPFIAFIQSLLLTIYIGLVSAIIINGNRWFGPIRGIEGPILFLLLFITSALISVFIVFWYSFYLFWYKKQIENAVKLIVLTTTWLVFFTIITLFLLLVI